MSRNAAAPRSCAALLLPTLALAAGCGPNTREASIAVLVVAVAVMVLANAVVWLLWLLWHQVRPGLGFRWRPFVVVGLALSAVGLFASTRPYHGNMAEYLGMALWAVGTSYLTFLLLVWRIGLSAPNGLVVAHAIAGTLMFAPALPLAFVGSTQGELDDPLLFLWAFPGVAGYVPGPLFGLLLLEALVRLARSRS